MVDDEEDWEALCTADAGEDCGGLVGVLEPFTHDEDDLDFAVNPLAAEDDDTGPAAPTCEEESAVVVGPGDGGLAGLYVAGCALKAARKFAKKGLFVDIGDLPKIVRVSFVWLNNRGRLKRATYGPRERASQPAGSG